MADWFEQAFGFREFTGADYKKTKHAFSLEGPVLTSKFKDGCQYIAGTFETPSLEELHGRLSRLPIEASLKGRLRVMEVIGDVTEFHIDPQNAFALFQAASQFNCLEHTSERGVPEHGITCYAHDRTQGPACATACGPGTVVRNYFGLQGNPQSTTQQVLNLREVELVLDNKKNNFFQVKSGYTLATNSSLQKLAEFMKKDPSVAEQVRAKLRVGIQADTQVTSSGFGRSLYKGPQQLVTQAYCSAISVSYSRCTDKSWEPFAREILKAAYEATMIAAIENAVRHPDKPGARKIFLTALGGGVFGNPMEWVHDAMLEAFEKFSDYNFEVYLVSYGYSEKFFQKLSERFP